MDRKIVTSQTAALTQDGIRLPPHAPLHPAMRDGPLHVWHLRRTGTAKSVFRAVHLTGAERAMAGLPGCGFATHVFRIVDREIVVDATVFTDLKTVRARHAATLGPAGEAIGQLVATGHEPRNIVKLLVHAGVIEANIHALATVAVMAEGRDAAGHWFRLLSDDRFRTDREGRDLYAFGVRISPAGMIRVTNPHSLPIG